jgi:hypothetical protein
MLSLAALLAIFSLSAPTPVRPPIHRGMVEDWIVRGSGTMSTPIRIVWLDSTRSTEGALDWTGLLEFPDSLLRSPDTVVLRFFDLRTLVDSGVSRFGSTSSWLRASCWMPYPPDPLPDSLEGLVSGGAPYASRGSAAWDLINRLVPGAEDLNCSNRLEQEVFPSLSYGKICVQHVAGECQECHDLPQTEILPGFGVVRRKSIALGYSWELKRLDGLVPGLSRTRSRAWPREGEAWTWNGGYSSSPPQHRMLMLDALPDSGGIPGWRVQLSRRGPGRGDSSWFSEMRIDSSVGWVRVGKSIASLWNPSPWADASFALGFLADWTVPDTDTATVFSYGTVTFCWGSLSSSESRSLVAVRDVGAVKLTSSSFSGGIQYGKGSTWQWAMAEHVAEGGRLDARARPHRQGIREGLQYRLQSDPNLLLRRISLDGRVRQERGSRAMPLLFERGVAVVVVGEGPGAPSFSLVNP